MASFGARAISPVQRQPETSASDWEKHSLSVEPNPASPQPPSLQMSEPIPTPSAGPSLVVSVAHREAGNEIQQASPRPAINKLDEEPPAKAMTPTQQKLLQKINSGADDSNSSACTTAAPTFQASHVSKSQPELQAVEETPRAEVNLSPHHEGAPAVQVPNMDLAKRDASYGTKYNPMSFYEDRMEQFFDTASSQEKGSKHEPASQETKLGSGIRPGTDGVTRLNPSAEPFQSQNQPLGKSPSRFWSIITLLTSN